MDCVLIDSRRLMKALAELKIGDSTYTVTTILRTWPGRPLHAEYRVMRNDKIIVDTDLVDVVAQVLTSRIKSGLVGELVDPLV